MTVPVRFVAACAVSDTMLMVATIPDNISEGENFSRIYYLNLQSDELWHYVDWEDHEIVSVCMRWATAERPRAGCAMTGSGIIEIANSQGAVYETIEGAGLEGTRSLGDLTRIRQIGSTLFACGGIGQVYRRDLNGWRAIDDELVSEAQTLFNAPSPPNVDQATAIRPKVERLKSLPNFNDIDGTAEHDVYVCGLGGNLHHFTDRWRRITSGTDRILTAIHAVSHEEIFVAGQDGLVLFGNAQDGFRTIGTFFEGSYIWSIRKFRGEVYVGTLNGLYRINGDQAVLVEGDGLTQTSQIIAIDAVDDTAMWIVSNRHAFRYDGNTIIQYRHGDNI